MAFTEDHVTTSLLFIILLRIIIDFTNAAFWMVLNLPLISNVFQYFLKNSLKLFQVYQQWWTQSLLLYSIGFFLILWKKLRYFSSFSLTFRFPNFVRRNKGIVCLTKLLCTPSDFNRSLIPVANKITINSLSFDNRYRMKSHKYWVERKVRRFIR